MVLSLAFILALVMSAIVLLIGIVIFSEVVEAMEVTLPAGIAGQIEGNFFGIEGGREVTTFPLQVHELNKDGTIISSVSITGLGFNAISMNGLAVDPTTGTMYGIAKDEANATARRLISIDPVTAVAVDIGNMGNKFSSLAINGDGTLRAVTGLGAFQTPLKLVAIPYQFHSVDKSTGQTTLLCTFVPPVASTVGSLAFNTKDGFMYWLTGFRDDVGTPIDQLSLLRIDNQSTCAFTLIPESGLSSFLQTINSLEVIGLAYSITDDVFYGAGLRVTANPVNATLDGRIFFDVDSSGVFCGNICLQPAFPSLPTLLTSVKGLAFDFTSGGQATFTPSEQSQIDTFTNAQAIGFTVIGILPVVLFFALFSIFSGRFE